MAVGRLLIDTSILVDYLRKQNKKKTKFYKIVDNHDLNETNVHGVCKRANLRDGQFWLVDCLPE